MILHGKLFTYMLWFIYYFFFNIYTLCVGFQAAVAEDLTDQPETTGQPSHAQSSTHSTPVDSVERQADRGDIYNPERHSSSDSDGDNSQNDPEDDVIGTMCRAPFSHDWGQHRFQDAMIIGLEPTGEDSKPMV